MPSATSMGDHLADAQHGPIEPDPFKPTGKSWSILFRVFVTSLLSYTAYIGQSVPSNLETINASIQDVRQRVDALESSAKTDRIVKLALDSAEQVWKQRYKVK